jgi:hypothetical protein
MANSATNPLINEHHDTTTVSAALNFISKVLNQVDPDDVVPHSFSECWGLSLLLSTCASALEAMNNPDFGKGESA